MEMPTVLMTMAKGHVLENNAANNTWRRKAGWEGLRDRELNYFLWENAPEITHVASCLAGCSEIAVGMST